MFLFSDKVLLALTIDYILNYDVFLSIYNSGGYSVYYFLFCFVLSFFWMIYLALLYKVDCCTNGEVDSLHV